MVEISPNIDPYEYFESPCLVNQKKYEALKYFFYEKQSAEKVAAKFGYTLTEVRQAKVVSSMIAICYDFCPSIFGTTSLSFNR
jgi:hypothetical protein